MLRRECGPNFYAFFRLKSDREKITRQLLQIVWKVYLFLESIAWKSHSFACWFLRFLTPHCFNENLSTAISRFISSSFFLLAFGNEGYFFLLHFIFAIESIRIPNWYLLDLKCRPSVSDTDRLGVIFLVVVIIPDRCSESILT